MDQMRKIVLVTKPDLLIFVDEAGEVRTRVAGG
jgi:hypothetical protein